ncbi:MarR family protein (plasmid) [Roseivivax sp. THAF40]|uniref:MarR family EPS-associated transcriptional regulator n=1 Tax=unclassified Roseivivax TaxID=2639302 RepID=UPI00126898AA|nr:MULTISPECIES: MarR family EPS-associated transcriptional regulator [unclassified Roseivivax]QFS84841.1 MarR family protein [Roseivivax sp. THAF197b]QFT48743.1 MarR family protein [Roseivivax sp. THAF40]
MTREVNEDVRFRVMRAVEQNPNVSQRELSDQLGVSLGIINYCLHGLVEKGHIKIRNFRASPNKLRYAYVLTPAGIAERVSLTKRFLKRRMAEYDALQAEIEALQEELGEPDRGA